MFTIAFTGGGTGGHIYPGLAVVERLSEKIECRVVWIGQGGGMDRSVVEGAGIEFVGIPSGKLRRYFSFRNFFDLFKIVAGFLAARRALSRLRPALLFSKGGFVSVPPCAAARSLRIPVLTHESDFSPGLATRLNARWADRVLTAYPETINALPAPARTRAIAVGNPVRAAFARADAARGRRFLGIGEERVLLVLGGSQGAAQVNGLIAANLAVLSERYVVVHQTGPGRDAAAEKSARYKPFEYLRGELPDVLAAAELVVGRSGAGTVWEAATAGKPMLLVPLCGSGTRGDQVENAAYFARAGAALSLVGAEASAEAFLAAVLRIEGDSALRARMGEAAAAIGKTDASARAAELILDAIGAGA